MPPTCVSIDLEMTSARSEAQEVIEIAAVKFSGDRVLDTWTTLVRPQAALPYTIQVLTGIDPADLARAPELKDVADQFKSFVGDDPLVAHSVGMDVGCLRRQGVVLENLQYDTFELASILLPQLSSYSLASLASHFEIAFPQQHRAEQDALATQQLFLRLMEIASELDLGLIQEINRLLNAHSWPLKDLFREIETTKSRVAMGSPIRPAMAAKLGGDDADLELLLPPEPAEEPLRPAKELMPIDGDKLARLLEPGGVMSRKFAGYEHREPQINMLRKVVEALNEGKQTILEAGTGTGKSLSYLLPSIYYATKNSDRVVVSTNTINLQDQLIQKDIPDLQRIVPIPFRATVVKGRSNYLCLQRLATFRRRADLNLTETLALIKILVWLPKTSTGDVAELNLTDAERGVWSKLFAHPDVCTPNTCRYARRGRCFLYRARAKAEASHVVVVNHALLLSDAMSASQVLPEYQNLIVDEAHHLEDSATDQFGYHLAARDLFGYLDELSPSSGGERRAGALGELPQHFRGSKAPPSEQKRAEELAKDAILKVNDARAAVDVFFQAVTSFVATRPGDNRGYEQRVRLTQSARAQPGWGPVEASWETLEIRLLALQEAVGKLSGHLEGLSKYELLEYEELMAHLQSLQTFNLEARTEGNALVANPADDRVYWIVLSQNAEAALHSAPLDVAPVLQSELYANKRSVLLTSATLTTAGSFRYVKGRVGIPDADELAVGSPFDYKKSTLILTPSSMPEPEQPLYQKTLHQTLARLCYATEGRALVLFTSHAQLRAAYQAIYQPLANQGILVLGHGVDGSPRRQLLNTFKTNPKTVLLGASSFWEGVDVVGDALSVLVITRLPFGVPSDPIVAARSELFSDPFSQYSIPQAILRFRQGFGRLIRSATDRGVVVVLDHRVQSKSYGQLFLKSLPSCQIKSPTVEEAPRLARAWLKGENQP